MKVINATWEKRNLDVDSVEVIIENGDSLQYVQEIMENIQGQYIVAKLPVGNIEIVKTLQKLGYCFIESTLSLEGKLKNLECPSIYKRFLPKVEFEYADIAFQEKILNEIKSGQIFRTDRIALDSQFSAEKSGVRYYNWIKDELAKGTRIAIALYNKIPVAFGISKKISDSRCDNILGGNFQEGANKGLGFLSIESNHFSAKNQGAAIVETKVSSNNLPILRLHMQFGYNIKTINYVFVKHQN